MMTMETALKTTLAKKNLEMEKLEKSKKSHLRMITSSAAKLKLKLGKIEDQKKIIGETEARKIRMYETHNPGFCYLRNGEYRKKLSSSNDNSYPDPVQCSGKLKIILFTENELDIYKTMCLHLLGTHIQNKNHIQRKDGRLCSYVKTQTVGNVANTLQSISERVKTFTTESPSKYDKMLPRYILDVKLLNCGVSTFSLKTCDFDSESDEESKRKRKQMVPIYLNNEIRMIINSVLEALEAVDSSKLKDLIELASSPEELRNMLSKEEIQDFICELAKNPLVMKPTYYDYVMAHLMFDKIPEKGTLETVAQVLEVHDDSELKKSLHQIRQGIWLRHIELTNSNIIPRNKSCLQDKMPAMDNFRTSNPLVNSNLKYIMKPSLDQLEIMKDENSKEPNFAFEKENEADSIKKGKDSNKPDSKTLNVYLEKISLSKNKEEADSSDEENYQQDQSSVESSKCDLHNLTNSQRILLGLKVASLKSRPINMHQFEGKKKINIEAIISPIVRPQVCDIDYKPNSTENHLRNFALPEKKVKKSMNKISKFSAMDLGNLTRGLLANLRLEISETENKKRVTAFLAKI